MCTQARGGLLLLYNISDAGSTKSNQRTGLALTSQAQHHLSNGKDICCVPMGIKSHQSNGEAFGIEALTVSEGAFW